MIEGWQMVAVGELQRVSLPRPPLATDEVLVEIHGCGVCHTDLAYFYEGVATRQTPPLILGHEIAGVVVAAGQGCENWLGSEVIVPAVLPCHDCALCRAGRSNRCLAQRMPGNSLGVYGGFASHIPVPARDLCVIPAGGRGQLSLAQLAVVADAVTTPWQAARRAGLADGQGAGARVIVIGAGGGVGGYMVQVAKALCAAQVVGIDLHAERLTALQGHGLDHGICSVGLSLEAIKAGFKEWCKAQTLPPQQGWTIFECSGTAAGQALGLALLGFVGTLVIVGYGTDTLDFNLSRLMALDAQVVGSWGCAPEHYDTVLTRVLAGDIAIAPFVELQPMRRIREVFAAAHAGELTRRVILTPDF